MDTARTSTALQPGTLYSLAELTAISAVCREYKMPLYVDGARLAYALACPENDVTLADLARVCDAFYIGGTKCGALFGEALVLPNDALLPHFFTVVKQHGALLAKGRLLGLQQMGRQLAFDSPTNQVFLVLEDNELERLSARVGFSFWEKFDAAHTVVRLAASWATTAEETNWLLAILEN